MVSKVGQTRQRCWTTKVRGAYYQGKGVPKNDQQDYAWLSVAAANGNDKAPEIRDMVANGLTSTDLTHAQTLAANYFDQYQLPK
ncbi:hypothetical protein D3C85_1711560 [compost metagenome]